MAVPRRIERIEPTVREARVTAGDPGYQAYRILQFAFVIAPVLAGLDKFFNILVVWEEYLTPAVPRLLGIQAQTFMMAVGVVEMVAGLIVAFKPSIGGWIVGLWLLGIVGNLLTIPGHFDIALRDVGLALGAFALARLGRRYEDTELVNDTPA